MELITQKETPTRYRKSCNFEFPSFVLQCLYVTLTFDDARTFLEKLSLHFASTKFHTINIVVNDDADSEIIRICFECFKGIRLHSIVIYEWVLENVES